MPLVRTNGWLYAISVLRQQPARLVRHCRFVTPLMRNHCLIYALRAWQVMAQPALSYDLAVNGGAPRSRTYSPHG